MKDKETIIKSLIENYEFDYDIAEDFYGWLMDGEEPKKEPSPKETKYRIIPFDIEKAKAGAEVIAGSGARVRILCYDRMEEDFPIVALSLYGNYEMLDSYTADGRNTDKQPTLRLLVPCERREGWVNIYKIADGSWSCGSKVFNSLTEAKENASSSTIDTIKIEWEE